MVSFRLPSVCGRCELGEMNMNWDENQHFDQSSSFMRGG